MENLQVVMVVDKGATTEKEAITLLDNMLTANSLATEYAYQLSEFFKAQGIEAKSWIVKAKDEKTYNAYKMALSRWRKANLSELERQAVTKGKGQGGGKSSHKASKPVTVTPESVKIAEDEIRKHPLEFVKSLSIAERKELFLLLKAEFEPVKKTDKAGKVQSIQPRV